MITLSAAIRGNGNKLFKHSPIIMRYFSLEPIYKEEFPPPKISKPPRVRTLKPFKENFIKNLFLGKMDPELLEYPEVLNNEEIESINNYKQLVRQCLKEIDSNEIDRSGKIPDDAMEMLRNIGLFKLKVPKSFDGFEMTETECAMVQEVLSTDSSIARLVAETNDLCIQAIRQFGSDLLKETYLPGIVSGSCVPCFAYMESGHWSDTKSNLNTIAVVSPDGKSYKINGKKPWVFNATSANVVILFAATSKKLEDDQRIQNLTAFIIDKDTDGIKVGEPVKKIGLRGIDIGDMTFNNVVVPVENVIGEVNNGLHLLTQILNIGRFNHGAQCSAIMRKLVNEAVEHCINEKSFQTPLTEWDYAKVKIGQMTSAAYTVESLTYFLAGMVDTTINPDILIESSLLKVIASESLQFVLQEYMQLMGHKTYCNNDYLDRILRDSHFYSVFHETNDHIKIMVTLFGLQHAGIAMQETVKKIRNPLMYPGFIMEKYYSMKIVQRKVPRHKLGLEGYLHPSLKPASNIMETMISGLHYATEALFARHGNEVIHRHSELVDLCQVAICIFAATANLSRASRSYCIGLRNAEAELNIALSSCTYFYRKSMYHTQRVIDGPLENSDRQLKDIGEHIFLNKRYSSEHPVARNF